MADLLQPQRGVQGQRWVQTLRGGQGEAGVAAIHMVVPCHRQHIPVGTDSRNIRTYSGHTVDQVVLTLPHMLQRRTPTTAWGGVHGVANLQIVELLLGLAPHAHQRHKGRLDKHSGISLQSELLHAASHLQPRLLRGAPAVRHSQCALGVRVVERCFEQVLAAHAGIELVDIGKQVDALCRLHADPCGHRTAPQITIASAHCRSLIVKQIKRKVGHRSRLCLEEP